MGARSYGPVSSRGQAPLFAIALFAALARVAGAQSPLISLPLNDPAYAQLDRAATAGCTVLDISPYRPWRIRAITAALDSARKDGACDERWLAPLIERFVPEPKMPEPLPLTDLTVTPITIPDTLAGAEPVRADPSAFKAAEPDTGAQWRVGGAITARITGLKEGETWPPWEDIRPTGEGTAPAVGILRGRISWADDDRVVAVAEAYIQSHRRNDPEVRGRKFRTTSGVLDFSEAYVATRVGRYLVVSFGRSHEAWLGAREGRESLVLSAHAPPMDRITLEATWGSGRWHARSVVGGLDRLTLTPELDSVPADRVARRAFVGHAITWRPRPSVEFTVGETGLLTRESAGMDLAYANPLMIYLVTENDASRAEVDDRNNLTVFGAARARLGGTTFDGELMVDDIQIDAADREEIPDQLAWRVSAARGLGQRVLGTVEYTRVGSFTYIRGDFSTAFQSYGRPVGSELGPDADRVRIRGDVWLTPKARVQMGGAIWRHGAQRLGRRPGVSAIGHAGEPFPSVRTDRPAVQRAVSLDLAAQWLDAMVPVSASVQLLRIHNVNNQPAPPRTYARLQVEASIRYRYP